MIVIDDTKIKVLAKMVHESNKAFCESIGDFSQVSWSEAPEYNHQSAMVSVRAICENPKLTGADIHDIWMKQKQADGWVHGSVKDKEKKTHPSLVPFEQLSASEQYKDYIVLYVTKSYLDFIGQG